MNFYNHEKNFQAFAIISQLFILATIVLLVLQSLPQFKMTKFDASENLTKITEGNETQILQVPDQVFSFTWLDYGEIFLIAWFTLEYLIRLWSAPSRWKYMKSGMAVVDLLSILPFFVELTVRLLQSAGKIGKRFEIIA